MGHNSSVIVILVIVSPQPMNQRPKEKFEVMVRVRSPRQEDRLTYTSQQLQNSLKTSPVLVSLTKRQLDDKVYQFNHVFTNQSQEQIFDSVEHIVPELFEGYNATFLAYGQTGTGKTYTVFGSKQAVTESTNRHPEAGVFYRIGSKLFAEIQKRMHQTQFSVRVSFVEFYLDGIHDLLNYEDKVGYAKLDLKQNVKQGVILKGLVQIPVKSVEELFKVVKNAIKARRTESTTINKSSSRSHAVIQITLLQRWNSQSHNGMETKYRKGILKIVDLAGSQRVSKTESSGDRLEEAKRINKEITTLGKCINMLATAQKTSQSRNNLLSQKFNLNKTHIPFRDSKLTRFLSQSLQGKSKVVLCVCVSGFAVHAQQTYSSLLFANQAITLKIDPKKNEESFRANSNNGNTSSLKLDTSFEAPPKKQPFQTFSKSVDSVSPKKPKTDRIDKQSLETLKDDINLIEAQISGKSQEVSFQRLDRAQLQNSLRTYGSAMSELQGQVQQYMLRMGQLQRKRKY